MDKQFSIPFLGDREIQIKADNFRKKFWDGSVPVDIEYIIDVKWGLDIVTIPNLKNLCPAHTLITSDWSSIYVDEEIFNNERYFNRLRFSFAHEIGHYILHKKLYESFGIKNIEDFYNFFEIMDPEQYGYLECQANKFANHLLVPRNILKTEKEKIIQSAKGSFDLNTFDEATLNSYIAQPLSNIFGVSDVTVEIALSS